MDEFDDFNFQETLNPAIFDSSFDPPHMHQNVRDRLMLIATSFLERMKIKLTPVDVVVVGSSANYNWSKYSDVDIHIIVNFADLDENHELVQDYFKMKKSEWNEQHHVKVKGFDTELYLQDIYEVNISGGIYSVENDKWIQEPSKDKHEIDKALLKLKVDDMVQQIDSLIANPEADSELFQQMKDKIMKMRRSGLAEGGEFSIENLTFKALRRNGKMGEVMRMINDKLDRRLTMEKRLAEAELHDVKEIKTFGDLEKLIQNIEISRKAGKVLDKAKKMVVDQVIGLVPGGSGVKSAYDFLKSIYKSPEMKKTKSVLDKLHVDDKLTSVVDDTVENAFIKFMVAQIAKYKPETAIPENWNMTEELKRFIKNEYEVEVKVPAAVKESKFNKLVSKFI
jgi:predicted nucleotidyltransferase